MKREHLLLILLVGLSAAYGVYSTMTMLFDNRIPYTISCDGLLLNPVKVYAISNTDRVSADTIYIHFEQSKVIAPTSLGYVYFDKANRGFALTNNHCIFNPIKGPPVNYFLPFCRTMHDGHLQRGIYFNPDEVIPQSTLVERGIKYNTAVGNRENRIALEFTKTEKGLLLSTKDDGLLTKYLLQRDSLNSFEVFFNKPIGNSTSPNIFWFDNTTKDSGLYKISVTPGLFRASYKVEDGQGIVVTAGEGCNPVFYINEFQFSLKPKYPPLTALLFVLYLVIISGFQIYLLRELGAAKSPLIKSLISFRLLLNCMAFMAVPLFLTSFYLVGGRSWYLALIVLLNLSYFIPKDIFRNLHINLDREYVTYFAWSVIILAPLIFKFGTINESLFGIIPTLHCQKALILLLFFVTQGTQINSSKHKYFLRLGFILIYSLLISWLTSDTGSFIYAGLAILLVELIRKSIPLKYVLLSVLAIAAIIIGIFRISPDSFLKDRKAYRIIAPYYSPDSKALTLANQSDRETYSNLILNLKNIENSEAPEFNDLMVPAGSRSTAHSDFAFHWSLTFGGTVFLILFLTIVFLLILKLLMLLYASIRLCRVRQGVGFTFPETREAELVRFLLALTLIGFTYPVASNLLLIPLTGQSIPVLSISIVEVAFLILLLISLENIFNDPSHYVKLKVDYSYSDVRKSIALGSLLIATVFSGAFAAQYLSISDSPEVLCWKKHISDEGIKLEQQIPDKNDKEELVAFAKKVIGNDNITAIAKVKKPVLKNLASLYYTNKPYNETYNESTVFSNSTAKLMAQMSIDSLFCIKRKIISGSFHPYGEVYAVFHQINNKSQTSVSQKYYNCIKLDYKSINTDLTAECNEALESHLTEIGVASNIGAITIVDNHNGGVISNSSYPLEAPVNSNEIYYFIGSLKKGLIAYCAVQVDFSYTQKKYGGKSFEEFLKYSDDYYAACLLKDLLANHRNQFNEILSKDFDLPLYSSTDDAFLDALPDKNDFVKPLDRNNQIYRQAIGQQRPYKFIDVLQWYARIACLKKLEINYSDETKKIDSLSITPLENNFLKMSFKEVLYGTASNVRIALAHNNVNVNQFTCKTGTAEKADKSGNSSSSFIISNDDYTIGVMLKGSIPENTQRLAAKDLFSKIIPILIKYKILNPII